MNFFWAKKKSAKKLTKNKKNIVANFYRVFKEKLTKKL